MQSKDECEEQEKYDLYQPLEDVKRKVQIEKPRQMIDTRAAEPVFKYQAPGIYISGPGFNI